MRKLRLLGKNANVTGNLPLRGCLKLLFVSAHSLAILVISCCSLIAGDLKGKVVITRSLSTDSEIVSRAIIRKYVGKRPAENHEHAEEQPAIVVYLEGVKTPNRTSEPKTMLLDQLNERFVPHVLPIMVGATVSFLNSDDVYHNVFSFSSAKSFDLGRYKKGKSREVTFDKPGVVKVYCDIHTHMNAFILVLENPYFATTDAQGNYLIKDIPPGDYVLKAWHGRWPEKSQSIRITESGEQIVNFEFP